MTGAVVMRTVEVALDHPAFDGHFPGEPVLPGVALLAEVLEAACAEPDLAQYIGAEPRLLVAKFLGAVRPGATLALVFRVGAKVLEWRIDEAGRAVASGQIGRAAMAEGAPP
jgi:3-hydroxyacyl-[acyl-carrier-protein] dehydratase